MLIWLTPSTGLWITPWPKNEKSCLSVGQAKHMNGILDNISIIAIQNYTIVEFTPLQTCLDMMTCEECLNSEMSIPCTWHQNSGCKVMSYLHKPKCPIQLKEISKGHSLV